jgi:hypothetical protein
MAGALPRLPPEARSRSLDLDHVGAHVGQMLRGERPQQNRRQIDHPHALQWSRHFLVPAMTFWSCPDRAIALCEMVVLQ